MTEIVIAENFAHDLREAFNRPTEWGGALFLQANSIGDRLLLHKLEIAGATDVLAASQTEVSFSPQFLTRVTREAKRTNTALALIHSHPDGHLYFSPTDDHTEQGLVEFMQRRNPGHDSYSCIWCGDQVIARKLGSQALLPVRIVGAETKINFPGGVSEDFSTFDRQIRAFGKDGQAKLSKLQVAIVGLGGTGSVLAQQLAHLGIKNYVLIDDDTVDLTNLNRVVGTGSNSLGRKKVDVAGEHIKSIRPDSLVEICNSSVVSNVAFELLCRVDCVFVCTDSHSSRAFLSEFSYQYLIPAFDIGVSLSADAGVVTAITGRTQMIAPGLPCLLCSNALSMQKIREELMSPEQRAADPYFNGDGVVQPSVISLNSTLVSIAVTMFMGAYLGVPTHPRWLSYDGIAGKLRPLTSKCDPECHICSSQGIVGAGDSRRLSMLPASHK